MITSVGTEERNVWVHDQRGERPVSSQGYSSTPRLSSDGKRLFYLQSANSSQDTRGGELWVSDLSTGQAFKVLPGVPMAYYAISPDDKRVVFETLDANDQHRLWMSSTQHRFAPHQIRSGNRLMVPQYAPSGRIYYTAQENGLSYLYRMKDDGSQEEKVVSEPIDSAFGISPDERFVVIYRTLNSEENFDAEAVPIGSGPWVRLCSGGCEANWTRDGKQMYFFWNSFTGNARTYVVPIIPGSGFPKLPKSGFQSEKELRTVATQVLVGNLAPGPDRTSYTFSKGTEHRNLYRIPLQ